jgi:DNA repair exonuclease SbcCD ATPase subunit
LIPALFWRLKHYLKAVNYEKSNCASCARGAGIFLLSKIIKLLGISIQNFKSFKGPPTEIMFPDGGFYFLGGRNEIEPRLGANGAGKSSLWDALFWCLYGTSIKGDKASDLVAWGCKRPEVQAVLDIDGELWTVARQGKPDVLSIQNFHHKAELATQGEIDALLGLSRLRFAQSVMFGQGVRFFLDLSVPDRGALLDEVLDLSLWDRLVERAGKQARAYELEQADAQRDHAFIAGQLDSLSDDETLTRQAQEWQQDREGQLLEICEKIEAAELSIVERQASLIPLRQDEYKTVTDSLDVTVRALHKELDVFAGQAALARSMRERALDQSRFYQKHDKCPTCEQLIERALKTKKQAEMQALIDESESDLEHAAAMQADLIKDLGLATEQRDALIREREASLATIKFANLEIQNKQTELNNLMKDMDRIEREIANNPFTMQIADLATKRAELEIELAGHKTREMNAQADLRHMDYWRTGFKRLKLFIIKRMLAMFEIETQAAASALGLADWSIKYVTETETKSGGIKSGVQILVSSPAATGNWSIWSGGESQRIRIAISLGLSNLIQRMAGVSYGFEIWDEPSAWLSPEGINDLMECLHYRADVTGKALWVIDHRVFDAATFDASYMMIKGAEGSRMEAT